METTDKRLISELTEQVSELKQIVEHMDALQKEQQEQIQMLLKNAKEIMRLSNDASRNSGEIVWAEVFNSTIARSDWLENKKFSPGRWAAGYPFLYALYRTLDEFRPHSILELGLGQTTNMISQYAAKNKSISHTVVEHDEKWIDFYKQANHLPDNIRIQLLPLTDKSVYKNDTEVYAYEGFEEALKGKKFDLISIDGPFGGYAKIYARVDILRVLPSCLEDSFVIFMDDSNRPGEKQTIKEMLAVLEKNNIKYSTGEYKGNKFTYIITSEDLKFLCTL